MEKNEIEVLDALKKWGIAFEYKEHEALFSMNGYTEIEKEMNVVVPKNLFLNNQQHTKFYLLIMPGEKRFKTKELSKQNVCIISGLAVGIDIAAHMEAIKYKGKTIAVLGGGLKNIYPPENREFLLQIIKNGGLAISEYSNEQETKNEGTQRLLSKIIFLESFHNVPAP